jgi:hypothetical protein
MNDKPIESTSLLAVVIVLIIVPDMSADREVDR